ncbi:4-diphosphocytidyl-2-C-methyl-D-erythritol kinase, chloroplastic-like isoform X2 [Quercus robur]|uniref:4-diphosphocytidyl-2-C-methyl-D-erythritol kinase, chloroplastic-like isoform X2 n=1 Tax=Quercus robur TaxID=38942 RepID=UPI0021628D5B|nr:4-diphosphocytidyl-2-C-methyl-D-erythritol kinase, chloroplastic-like isoform X2 [Quercus robur]
MLGEILNRCELTVLAKRFLICCSLLTIPLRRARARARAISLYLSQMGHLIFTQTHSSKRVGAMVSDSNTPTRRQVEVVYNPKERINKLADEVDKEAPLSRLTLFSPCKVNVFLRITNKREDGFHDLASLFHFGS